MITKLAEKCVAASVKGKIIPEDESAFFTFAFGLMLSQAFGIATCLIIGAIFQCIIESIIYLLFFIPLRTFSGGFHAGSHLNCYISSVLLFGFCVFLGVYISTILQLLIITILFTCCTLAVLFIAPVEDKNKPLSEPEVKKCKAKVKVILSLYSIIFAILCCFSQTQRYAVFIMLAVATVSILVGISKIVDLAKKRTAI